MIEEALYDIFVGLSEDERLRYGASCCYNTEGNRIWRAEGRWCEIGEYLLTAEPGAINAPLASDGTTGTGAGMLSILRQKLSLLVTSAAATPLLGRVRAREHHIDAR